MSRYSSRFGGGSSYSSYSPSNYSSSGSSYNSAFSNTRSRFLSSGVSYSRVDSTPRSSAYSSSSSRVRDASLPRGSTRRSSADHLSLSSSNDRSSRTRPSTDSSSSSYSSRYGTGTSTSRDTSSSKHDSSTSGYGSRSSYGSRGTGTGSTTTDTASRKDSGGYTSSYSSRGSGSGTTDTSSIRDTSSTSSTSAPWSVRKITPDRLATESRWSSSSRKITPDSPLSSSSSTPWSSRSRRTSNETSALTNSSDSTISSSPWTSQIRRPSTESSSVSSSMSWGTRRRPSTETSTIETTTRADRKTSDDNSSESSKSNPWRTRRRPTQDSSSTTDDSSSKQEENEPSVSYSSRTSTDSGYASIAENDISNSSLSATTPQENNHVSMQNGNLETTAHSPVSSAKSINDTDSKDKNDSSSNVICNGYSETKTASSHKPVSNATAKPFGAYTGTFSSWGSRGKPQVTENESTPSPPPVQNKTSTTRKLGIYGNLKDKFEPSSSQGVSQAGLQPTFQLRPSQPIAKKPPKPKSRQINGYSGEVEEYQMVTNGELPSVINRLANLLLTGQFADLHIKVGPIGCETLFKAHRLMLATASQTLYKLIYIANPHPDPGEVTIIRVADMDPDAFEIILNYIYTDRIDIKTPNEAFDLQKASKKWGLKGLAERATDFLKDFISGFEPTTSQHKQYLFQLLQMSEEKNMPELNGKCWLLIDKYACQLINCEAFHDLDKTTVKEILKRNSLNLTDHLSLFEGVRDWGKTYCKKNRIREATHMAMLVEDLIKYVDFDRIEDKDFTTVVLPSDCLGKAEIISFFMTRSLEIPRSLEFKNNQQSPFWLWYYLNSEPTVPGCTPVRKAPGEISSPLQNELEELGTKMKINPMSNSMQNGKSVEFYKVQRFRKGYKVPANEIYQEHEVRFRTDENVKLVGCGFGYLFSNTDMGITIHCQGPWEKRQWSDIIQTYCRVRAEDMTTADVKLLFADPVELEANQSYKVLVRVTRMNASSTEVDLWGGSHGIPHAKVLDADFFFLKAAIDPKKSVDVSDHDTSNGMITELFFVES